MKGRLVMALNSKQKGKAGELELAHILKDYGYDTRRGQQYCGADAKANGSNKGSTESQCD